MTVSQPTGSIRGSLTWRVGALVSAALLVFGVAYYVAVLMPYGGRIATAGLAAAAANARAHLTSLFDEVHSDLALAKTRLSAEAAEPRDLEAFSARFTSYLLYKVHVSSVLFAHESGQELLLLQLADGRWMNRVTDPALPGKIRRIWRDAAGRVTSNALEVSDYDPRRRPWFQGAMALASDEATNWTEPYTFFTTKEPGITASVRWSGERGERYVLAFDVLLRDLASSVRKIEVTRRGFIAILTADGKVLVPPRVAGLDEAKAAASALLPVAALGVEPLSRAYAARRAQADAGEADFTFDDGTWRARFERFALGGTSIEIVTAAPSADFTPSVASLAFALAVTGSVVLLAGLWLAWQLARRVSQPLEALAGESARIGRLDFSDRPAVRSSWREIDSLAEEQARMRELLRDATGRLEEANRGLEERVALRTRALELANAELASFDYTVSHDLRAPLRAINGFCTILEKDFAARLDDVGRQHLARVRDASAQMADLIDGLLTMVRHSSRPLELRDTDLSAMAVEELEQLRRTEPERRVRVEVEPGLHARADPVLLRSVLQNLVGNAWKYTAGCELAEIGFGAGERGGERVFFVRDNGVGFDMAHAARLFEPFQRLHAEPDFQGMGIGLASVQRIIARHLGRVWAESAPGAGARFYFTLGSQA